MGLIDLNFLVAECGPLFDVFTEGQQQGQGQRWVWQKVWPHERSAGFSVLLAKNAL